MKVLVVLAVTLAFCGLSLADEDKKTRILTFWKCLSCHKDPAAKEEFEKCLPMRGELCNKIADECKAKIMPDAVTLGARFETVCKNEHNEAEQLYDCMMNDERRKNLDDEEKSKMKEFIKCARAVNDKFCH